jgi:hypothetical protein
MTKRKAKMDLAPQRESTWVESMREHRATTGAYRSEDVNRLLGAPWQRVEIEIKDAQLGCRVVK